MNSFNIIFVLFVAFNCCIWEAVSQRTVTFYEHANRRGQYINIILEENYECKNLPDFFNDRASSADLHENCIYVYAHGDCNDHLDSYCPECGGDEIRFTDEVNDKISSFRECTNV